MRSPCSVLQDVDKWSFDVFSLNEASGDHALKFIFYELLTRYDLISRFKVSTSLKRYTAYIYLSFCDFYAKTKGILLST